MGKTDIRLLPAINGVFLDPYYPERGLRDRYGCKSKKKCSDADGMGDLVVVWTNDGDSKTKAYRYEWDGKCNLHAREWFKRNKAGEFPDEATLERRKQTMEAAIDVHAYLMTLPDRFGWYELYLKTDVEITRLNRQAYEDACGIFNVPTLDDASCATRQKRFDARVFEEGTPEELTRELLAYVRGIAINCWEKLLLGRAKDYRHDEEPDILARELNYISLLNEKTGYALNPYCWDASMVDVATHTLKTASKAAKVVFSQTKTLGDLTSASAENLEEQSVINKQIKELEQQRRTLQVARNKIEADLNTERCRQLKEDFGFSDGCYVIDKRGDRFRIDEITWPLKGIQVDEEGREARRSFPTQLGVTLALLTMDDSGKLVAA